jgi:hypothetical protein
MSDEDFGKNSQSRVSVLDTDDSFETPYEAHSRSSEESDERVDLIEHSTNQVCARESSYLALCLRGREGEKKDMPEHLVQKKDPTSGLEQSILL